MNNAKQRAAACPEALVAVPEETRPAVDDLVQLGLNYEGTLGHFEQQLFVLMAALGCAVTRRFLAARPQRLDVTPYLQDGPYRRGDAVAPCTLKTAYGGVASVRVHLIQRRGGAGFYPWDAVLGRTRDRLSPWVRQRLGRLATRLSFASTRLRGRAVLGWSPATATIEQVVRGLGRPAASFQAQWAAPPDEGETLVLEIDGPGPPTATAAELAQRRGQRRPKQRCACGCQRHRGKAQRKARGSKKRRKKGDQSTNGKEVVLVVLYTLRRGDDGQQHGPINKKVGASFAGRKAAALLQLRCIELNGDGDAFFDWVQDRNHERLQKRQRLRVLTDQPIKIARAA